ncbi:Histone-lysine n-methyltransferase nsd3, partial [Globisporangium splendens]
MRAPQTQQHGGEHGNHQEQRDEWRLHARVRMPRARDHPYVLVHRERGVFSATYFDASSRPICSGLALWGRPSAGGESSLFVRLMLALTYSFPPPVARVEKVWLAFTECSMNKRLAFDNRLCYERAVAHHHLLHQQKLQTILPTVLSPSRVYLDSNAPSKQPHLSTNVKRKQLEKEKQSEIASQNQRLAYKVEQILHGRENAMLAVSSTYGVTHPRSPCITGGGASSDAPLLYTQPSPPSPVARSNECTAVAEEQTRRTATPKPKTPVPPAPEWHRRILASTSENVDRRFSSARSSVAAISAKAKTSHGLPQLHSPNGDSNTTPSPPASNRTARTQQQQRSIGSRSNSKQKPPSTTTTSQPRHPPVRDDECDSTAADDDDDSDNRVVDLPPCVLLEATTRKGVHLHVEELQVEVVRRNLLVSERDLGDRYHFVWRLEMYVKGCHHVSMDTLQRVAQETEDLEIMIKLETVACIPQFGANFPRLSNLLMEEELETLLVRLVQRIHIEVIEDRNEVRISMRPPQIPSGRNKHDASNGGDTAEHRQPRRPRSCPSTMSSSTSAHTQKWM